jgi:integrase
VVGIVTGEMRATREAIHAGAADAVYRQRGDVAMAQMLLRHESLSTTQAYLHPTKRDLAETLRALDAAWTESN